MTNIDDPILKAITKYKTDLSISRIRHDLRKNGIYLFLRILEREIDQLINKQISKGNR